MFVPEMARSMITDTLEMPKTDQQSYNTDSKLVGS